MIRTISILLVCLCASLVVHAQSLPRLIMGYEHNIDLLKYTQSARHYNELSNDLHSSTQSFNIGCNHTFKKRKWSVGAGFTFRKAKLETSNYFHYMTIYSVWDETNMTIPNFGSYQCISKSRGFYIESDHLVHRGKFFHGNIGLYSAWLVNENYKAIYAYKSLPNNAMYPPKPANSSQQREWFLSATYVSAYYRFNFTSIEKSHPYRLDFSIKTSIGTNLYSDWDQFKRYVWIGLGAEVGISLKKKVKKQNESI